ncbi:hypothetical protein Y032_0065g3637 [Ancylostoma ceylanicum]|uniref:Uncharacterized protein n=1 Tax=Ancylostoma ceylanicum TaxID=53326 RepID=A0A016U1Z1_9BILA|nr:hypothetical protein Y032_0065g3637 [Ancylostoma ceylanicum]
MFIEMNLSAAAIIDRTSISVLEKNAVLSVSFHCGMKLLVQLAEDFEILGQRIPQCLTSFSFSSDQQTLDFLDALGSAMYNI